MMNYLYKNWMYSCLPLAIYIGVLLLSSIHQIPGIILLIWAQFPIYLIHEFEEHAYPGGFKDFINKHIFKAEILNDKNVFWINIPAIWILFPLGALLAQNVNPSIGCILPAFGLFNATLHIALFLIKRKYNPGLLISLFVNYPTGIFTIWLMHHLHLLTGWTLFYSSGIAFVSHIGIVFYAMKHLKKLRQKT